MDNSSDNRDVIQVGLPKPSAESNLLMAMAAAAALGVSIPDFGFKTPRARVQKEEPCLNCGKLKTHSNAFCSGDCCRAWKSKKS